MCSSEFNLQGTNMNYLPSKELLSEVLETKAWNIKTINNTVMLLIGNGSEYRLNVHELAHKNLKEWAKLKNVFDIIDWSEEPEQIFKKAEELRNEIN